jgi:hypothetical protein
VALSLSRTRRYYPALVVFLFAASTTVGLIHTVGVDSAPAHGMSAGTNNDHLQATVPTSAYPGRYSGHLLLGESCPPGLAVGTYSVINHPGEHPAGYPVPADRFA